jgi:hypothetical protein
VARAAGNEVERRRRRTGLWNCGRTGEISHRRAFAMGTPSPRRVSLFAPSSKGAIVLRCGCRAPLSDPFPLLSSRWGTQRPAKGSPKAVHPPPGTCSVRSWTPPTAVSWRRPPVRASRWRAYWASSRSGGCRGRTSPRSVRRMSGSDAEALDHGPLLISCLVILTS